jgi:hypothetical protein
MIVPSPFTSIIVSCCLLVPFRACLEKKNYNRQDTDNHFKIQLPLVLWPSRFETVTLLLNSEHDHQ